MRPAPRVRRVLVLVAALTMAGCRSGPESGSAALTGRVLAADGPGDGLTIRFGSAPDPPARGANAVEVTVSQPDGAPLADLTVATVFSMPAMPAMNMPAMRTEAILEHDDQGRYRGICELSMGGTWNVVVTVSRGSTELAIRRFSIVASN